MTGFTMQTDELFNEKNNVAIRLALEENIFYEGGGMWYIRSSGMTVSTEEMCSQLCNRVCEYLGD